MVSLVVVGAVTSSDALLMAYVIVFRANTSQISHSGDIRASSPNQSVHFISGLLPEVIRLQETEVCLPCPMPPT